MENINELVELLIEEESISLVLSNELSMEILKELHSQDFEIDMNVSEYLDIKDNEVIVISKTCDGILFEGLYGIINDEIVIVEDELLNEEEMELIQPEELYILFFEDEELEEYLECLSEDLIDEILENVDNDDYCEVCAIKDYLRSAYEMGYEDCLNEE